MATTTTTSAGGNLVDIDRGYRSAVEALERLHRASVGGRGGPGVFVGVRDNGDTDDDGTPLVLIAAVNEFGSVDGHVPERSYLRSTADAKRDEYAAAIVAIVDAAMKAPAGQSDRVVRRGLGRLGAKAVGDVKRTITALDTPANAPSTIEKKGADNPLIDTGRLRQSIDFDVRGV